jgi:hypothetical protein
MDKLMVDIFKLGIRISLDEAARPWMKMISDKNHY